METDLSEMIKRKEDFHNQIYQLLIQEACERGLDSLEEKYDLFLNFVAYLQFSVDFIGEHLIGHASFGYPFDQVGYKNLFNTETCLHIDQKEIPMLLMNEETIALVKKFISLVPACKMSDD